MDTQPTINPQPSAQAAAPQSKSGLAIAGLVLGIVALLTSFLPIINNLSAVLAVLGLVLGVVGMIGISKGKKSGKGLAIAAIVICVVSFAVVIGTQSMYSAAIDEATESMVSDSPSASSTATESTDEAASSDAAKYAIADETLDTSNEYSANITGTFTNNTGSEMSYAQLTYTLYDASGAQIGTALANTNNLKAGGSWKFEAYSGVEPANVATYELSDVTCW